MRTIEDYWNGDSPHILFVKLVFVRSTPKVTGIRREHGLKQRTLKR